MMGERGRDSDRGGEAGRIGSDSEQKVSEQSCVLSDRNAFLQFMALYDRFADLKDQEQRLQRVKPRSPTLRSMYRD